MSWIQKIIKYFTEDKKVIVARGYNSGYYLDKGQLVKMDEDEYHANYS